MINQDTYYPPLLYSLIPDEIQVGLIKNEGNPSKLIRNEGTLPQYPPEHSWMSFGSGSLFLDLMPPMN